MIAMLGKAQGKTGLGRSKKEAEQIAARETLNSIIVKSPAEPEPAPGR